MLQGQGMSSVGSQQVLEQFPKDVRGNLDSFAPDTAWIHRVATPVEELSYSMPNPFATMPCTISGIGEVLPTKETMEPEYQAW